MTLIRNTSVQALALGSSEVFGETLTGLVVIWGIKATSMAIERKLDWTLG